MADTSAQEKEVAELARIIAQQPQGIDLGQVSKEDIARTVTRGTVKAILFVPEGGSIESDLDIQVVGVKPSTLAAMVARRC